MLNEFRYTEQRDWNHERVLICCPDPPPQSNPPDSDCCANTWQWELNGVNLELQQVTIELDYVQKHLDVVTLRYNRLKLWRDELATANDLAEKICQQLEVIEMQIAMICKNTHFTIKAVEILFCMLREFYLVVDCLQEKYECLMRCIKCLNNPVLNPTQGIGKYLTDYGTALTAVLATRAALIDAAMKAIEQAYRLNRQICDHYGYKKVIECWEGTLHCGIPCIEEGHGGHKHPVPGPSAPPVETIGGEEIFCLEPILRFPICNDPYYQNIAEWFEEEKSEKKMLTTLRDDLTKKKLSLEASQTSLTNALKEVGPTQRCS